MRLPQQLFVLAYAARALATVPQPHGMVRATSRSAVAAPNGSQSFPSLSDGQFGLLTQSRSVRKSPFSYHSRRIAVGSLRAPQRKMQTSGNAHRRQNRGVRHGWKSRTLIVINQWEIKETSEEVEIRSCRARAAFLLRSLRRRPPARARRTRAAIRGRPARPRSRCVDKKIIGGVVNAGRLFSVV